MRATTWNVDTKELDPPTPDITVPVQLYGPGDILGFDPRIVVRTDPKPDVGDFEPNCFPAIEFADANFAWRFSPDFVPLPENKDKDRPLPKLRPWIALIVLVAEPWVEGVQKEFEEGDQTDRNLPRHITINTAALPDLEHGLALGPRAHRR